MTDPIRQNIDDRMEIAWLEVLVSNTVLADNLAQLPDSLKSMAKSIFQYGYIKAYGDVLNEAKKAE